MARSLKSKRRRKNLRALRERYKPKYDAQLQSIVANMQKETEDLMETVGEVDLESEIQTIDPDQMDEDCTENDDSIENKTDGSEKKIKIPKVDMSKVGKFMSQRKRRKFQKSLREKKQTLKKKVKSGGVQKNPSKPKIKW